MDSIDYYNLCASNYYKDTVELNLDKIREDFLSYIPEDGAILDLGCGSGRDSGYFMERGMDVTSLDGSTELAELASIHIGQEVLVMEYKDIDFDQVFDGVWACGSFSHSTESELYDGIKKIYKSLKTEGILYLSFRYGEYEGTKHGLYYKEFRTKELKSLFERFDGFEIMNCFKSDDVRIGKDNQWIHIILKKEEI